MWHWKFCSYVLGFVFNCIFFFVIFVKERLFVNIGYNLLSCVGTEGAFVETARFCFLWGFQRSRQDENVTREGCTMAQAVSCWPLTAESRVRARAQPCGICGAQSGTGTGFSQISSFYHVSIISPSLSIYIYIYIYIIPGMNSLPFSGSSSET
jgi:hypothetical protein